MSLLKSASTNGVKNPWPCNCTSDCSLRDEIMEFCKWISPTKEETMMRESVIVRISCVVSTLWPSAQVKTYGSYATQLYLPNSDIDLCVTGVLPSTNEQQSLHQLADFLRTKDIATSLQVIPSAKVPIIKMTDKVSGAIVDISINHDVRTNQLVADYTSKYPELRPLALILKYFLYQRRLHECYNGGLSSYSLIVVIISFLQFHVPLRVASNGCMAPKTPQDLGSLLIKFFKFYGATFDYETMGISITNNGSIFPKASRNWYDPFNPCCMSIESPFEPNIDLGRGMFAASQVRAAFHDAYKHLTEHTRLGSILSIDPAVVQRRQQINSLYSRTPTPVPAPTLIPLSSPILTTQCSLPSPPVVSPSPSPTPSRSRKPATSSPTTAGTPRSETTHIRARNQRHQMANKRRFSKKSVHSHSRSPSCITPPPSSTKNMQNSMCIKDGASSIAISSYCPDGASMDGASVIGASMNAASLNGASTGAASMNGASTNAASTNAASMSGASVNTASMNGASMNGASTNCKPTTTVVVKKVLVMKPKC